MAAREVLIVLYDGVQSLDVTGPLEVFTGGSRYQETARAGPGLRGPHRARRTARRSPPPAG